MIIFFLLEGVIPRKIPKNDQKNRWLSNISLALFNHFFMILYSALLVSILIVFKPSSPLLEMFKVSDVFALIILLFLMELVHYGLHRLFHQLPFLWRIHKVHHSDTDIDVTTSHRQHPFELIISALIMTPIFFILGAPILSIVVYNLIHVLFSLFSHSNITLPRRLDALLRLFVVTPDFHRLHHSSEKRYTDSNYSALFPVVDRLFGTATQRPYHEMATMQIGLEALREPQHNRIDTMLLTPFFSSYLLKERQKPLYITFFLSVVVISLVLLAWFDHSTFEQWMQEDSWIEWATFYAFVGAGLITLRWLYTHSTMLMNLHVFAFLSVLGVALFCLFVAGEEISWGQRLFAIKPPDFFLAMNQQQELNLHNFFNTKAFFHIPLKGRYLAAFIAIFYGVFLTTLLYFIKPSLFTDIIKIIAPPVTLMLWFMLVAVMTLFLPIQFIGESAEFILGLLFLIAALSLSTKQCDKNRTSWDIASLKGAIIVILLGVVTPSLLQATLYSKEGKYVVQTQLELKKIRDDILQNNTVTPNLKKTSLLHQRIYHAMGMQYFQLSSSKRLTEDNKNEKPSVPKTPKNYFLDPWNNPYWVHYSRVSRQITFYSFGPNRLRDTTNFSATSLGNKKRGDDISITLGISNDRNSFMLHQ